MSETPADTRALARRVRTQCLRMVHRAKASHIGSALSIADLMAVLYGGVMRVDPRRPDWSERDRFLLSKGHACTAAYATLAETGFFDRALLETFSRDGSRLAGHITSGTPGVEVSTGSLGHGLSIACGMALAAKMNGESYRTFALLSDGECDEGSIWEAAMLAGHHHLDNLIVIVDYNKIQSLGQVSEILDLEPFAAKWGAFRWAVQEVDGHDVRALTETFAAVPFSAGQPSCVIAHTVKGKGVSFMEDLVEFHYKPPSDEQLARALAEVEAS